MPKGKTHRVVGAAAGVVTAAVDSRTLPEHVRPLVIVGGALGGTVGGALPDVLEPAFTPRHRDWAHGWASLGLAISTNLAALSTACLEQANECERKAVTAPEGGLQGLGWQLAAAFWRILAGFLSGFQAGYISHLALDACTPSGLPLLCR